MSGPKSFCIVDAAALRRRAIANAERELNELTRQLEQLRNQARELLGEQNANRVHATNQTATDADELAALASAVRAARDEITQLQHRVIAEQRRREALAIANAQLAKLREDIATLTSEHRALGGADANEPTATSGSAKLMTDLTLAHEKIAELEAVKASIMGRIKQRRSAMRRELIDDVMRNSDRLAREQPTPTPIAPPLEAPPRALNPAVERILARLDADVPEATRAELLARAARIQAGGARERVLTDDLRDRVSNANDALKQWRAEADRLTALRFELQAASDPAAEAHLATVGAALLARRALTLPEYAIIDEFLRAARAQLDRGVVQRRVEEALSALGYTLGPPFQTLFVEGGTALVQLPDHDGYFVRWSVDALGERVNTFLVRDQSAPAAQAAFDTAAETSWCDDFAQLQVALRNQGLEARLERQTAVGVHPVPAMAVPAATAGQVAASRRRRSKNLKAAP